MPTSVPEQSLYLDLLKLCLTDSIYCDDPLANYVPYRIKPVTAAWKRVAIGALQSFLSRYHLRLVEPHSVPWAPEYATMSAARIAELRKKNLYFSARGHTLISPERLDNLQYCVETVIKDRIPGDLIETGVWRGGACIFMRGILKVHGEDARTVWLADSFQGLPPPDEEKYPADAGGKYHLWSEYLGVSREAVEDNFRRYGLLDDQVKFLVGWFKDTLPTAPIERLAVLRLDGDMYEATIQALEGLYHRLSPGGFVIVDDYFLAPCAKAVHDFRTAFGIDDEIRNIDGRGVFWRRST